MSSQIRIKLSHFHGRKYQHKQHAPRGLGLLQREMGSTPFMALLLVCTGSWAYSAHEALTGKRPTQGAEKVLMESQEPRCHQK